MRMMPTRTLSPKPLLVKGRIASETATFTAPLKGLNLSTEQTTGDPQTAPILSNFVVNESSVDCRPGFRSFYSHPDLKPVVTMAPFAGASPQLLLATNGKLCTTGATLNSGYLADDWSWTSFANLGQVDYLVLANGHDGVWSWDGGALPTVAPGIVTVSKLTKTNPATCTVASTDISKFHNGDYVTITGGSGTGMVNANGPHLITSVNVPPNTFTLAGVDCSTGTADQTTGVTAQPAMSGDLVKEMIIGATGDGWFNANLINIVLAHQNRIFMADTVNLVAYYLPLQQKNGVVKKIPLNAVFKRGGTVRAMYSWSIDGGAGQNNQLVIYTDQNEAAIYQGTDPDTDFSLVGVYRFDSPMSKHALRQYGGELYVLISTGVVPMSTLMRAEAEQLGIADRSVLTEFQQVSSRNPAGVGGWHLGMDYSTGRMIANMPLGAANTYRQLVRKMPASIWTRFDNLPARTWAWLGNTLYFGDDLGNVWILDPLQLSDNGNPIHCDLQFAWSTFRSAAFKDIKMVRLYYTTDGNPQPFVDVKTDFDPSPAQNRPDVSQSLFGAVWDVADWDISDWAAGELTYGGWNGCAAKGNVVAVRVTCDVLGCSFKVKGADVLWEQGSVMG
jgi:hypothetical protein